MVWMEYPPEVKKYFDIIDPFLEDILHHKPVPDYVKEAFEKAKEWAWKQGQQRMAKDDYHVIAAKILVHLYKKYKQKEVDPNYILPLTKDFPIQEQQLIETVFRGYEKCPFESKLLLGR